MEGHWHYVCAFVELSEGLSFETAGDHRETPVPPRLVLKDGWYFVFGGDSCDKGPGSLRFLNAVVELKKRHPDKVPLLLGNRDINKMRFTSELDQAYIDRLSEETPGAYWVTGKPRLRPWPYVRGEACRQIGVADDEITDNQVRLYNTKAIRLRYHLKHDMGSDGEFQFRRQELTKIERRCIDTVTDEKVVASFESSVAEGGIMREYLKYGEFACIIGKTLFVHGQIIGNFEKLPGDVWCVGQVPESRDANDLPQSRRVDDIGQWVKDLNAWAQRELKAWIEEPQWTVPPTNETYEGWSGRGGADLISYGTPAAQHPSVVYCRWLGDNRMPRKYPDDLVQYLHGQGIRHVIVGHTPHGNCPTVIPNSQGDYVITVIMADTGFSQMKSNEAFPGDNRGSAVTEVLIKNGRVRVKGCASPDQMIDYEVPSSEGGDPRIGRVGQLDCDGGQKGKTPHFVKAEVVRTHQQDGQKYLLCNMKDFTVSYQEATGEWVDTNFFAGEGLPGGTSTIPLSSTSEDAVKSFTGHSQGVLDKIFQKLDRAADAEATLHDMRSACTDRGVREALAKSYPDFNFEEIFKHLDTNHDGAITLAQLRVALERGLRRG